MIVIDRDLSLRELTIHDAKDLFALVDKNRTQLSEFLSWVSKTKAVSDSETFILNSQNSNLAGGTCIRGIFYHEKIIGMISLFDIKTQSRSAFMGYWLDQDHQGKGVMTRSVLALLRFGFKSMRLHRIEIRAAPENTRSRKIPERLGFTEEGRLREAEFLGDRYVDHCVYSLLQSDKSAAAL